jgi:hypothetical protein
MAIAIDQVTLGANTSGASSTIVLTTSAQAAAGSRITVFVHGTQTVTSVTDSNGNTYALDRGQTNGGSRGEVWSAHSASALASGSSITVTYSASSNPCYVSASSFTGVLSASAVDQVNSRSTFNSTSWNTGSITPAVSPTVVVGFFASGGAAASTSTPDGGWTELQDASSGSNCRTAVYQIVSDTSARNPSGVWAVSQSGADQIGITVNYKEASGTISKTLTNATETDAAQALTWSKTYQSSWGDLGIEYGMLPFSGENFVGESGRRRYSLPPMSP